MEGRRIVAAGSYVGREIKEEKNGKERCALERGQRESPLERLRPKSLIYICSFLLLSWHLFLLPVAPFPRSGARIPLYSFSRSLPAREWMREKTEGFPVYSENLHSSLTMINKKCYQTPRWNVYRYNGFFILKIYPRKTQYPFLYNVIYLSPNKQCTYY